MAHKSIERAREANKIKNRRYRQTDGYRNTIKLWLKGNIKRKIRGLANTTVFKAVKDGLIKKLPCELCGKPSEAHHDSYKKKDFLKVRWLCKIHHEEWHKHNKAKF